MRPAGDNADERGLDSRESLDSQQAEAGGLERREWLDSELLKGERLSSRESSGSQPQSLDLTNEGAEAAPHPMRSEVQLTQHYDDDEFRSVPSCSH